MFMDLANWNRKRNWYRLYIYLQLMRSEKNLSFNSRLEIANNVGYLYPKHYEKLKKHKKPVVRPYVDHNMYISDLETGVTEEIKDIPTVTMAINREGNREPSISYSYPMKFTGTMEMSSKAKRMLFGDKVTFKGSIDEVIGKTNSFTKDMKELHGDKVKFTNFDVSRNRTHKRYRTNKKWAKRYGYTVTFRYYLN